MSTVNIKQVAQRAGVSVGTVSRVLNGYTSINPRRLERVNQAIEELGYQRNRAAQLLATQRRGSLARTGNVAVVFTDMGSAWANHPLLAAYVSGLERACSERGFHLLVELHPTGQVPSCVRDHKVDGLVIKATNQLPTFMAHLPSDLPIVGLSMYEPALPFTQVLLDNRAAGWSVTEHLWQQGHRRIAYICTVASHRMFIPRFQGYQEFLMARGSYQPELVWSQNHPTVHNNPEQSFPDLSAVVEPWFNLPPAQRPTAAVTANDWMAGALYQALAQRGLRVPDDLSVIGIDDSVVCTAVMPGLTSYALPFDVAAHAAAVALIEQIEDPAKRQTCHMQMVRGHLVPRASVRPLLVQTTDSVNAASPLEEQTS